MYNGGGIFSDPSANYSTASNEINIINSQIDNNIADSSNGGGIHAYSPADFGSYATVKITNSSISGNSAKNGAGGGVLLETGSHLAGVASQGLFLTKSTISNNIASEGAGVYAGSFANSSYNFSSASSASKVYINTSTITGNTATKGDGGAVSCHASAAAWGPYSSSYGNALINITNSTIYKNEAPKGAVAYCKAWGTSSSEKITIRSSIAAFNVSSSDSVFYPLDSSLVASGGYNIFSDSLPVMASTDKVIQDTLLLNLQPLAYNGGPTKTMLPGPGSIAINNGTPSDLSDAQNGPICGIRDVGAAETGLAFSTLNISACDSFVFAGKTLKISGTYYDTLQAVSGCDSIVTLNLDIKKVNKEVLVIDSLLNSESIGSFISMVKL